MTSVTPGLDALLRSGMFGWGLASWDRDVERNVSALGSDAAALVGLQPLSVDPVREAVAGNLRRARVSRGMSLRELAERAETSKALLSQLERGVANPTLDVLSRISAALELTVPELIRSSLLEPQVLRGGEGPELLVDGVSIRTLFSTADRRRMDFSEGRLPPGSRSAKNSHGRGSIEYAYVVEGLVTIESQGWAVQLKRGDSVRFSAEAEHVYMTGSRPARVLTLLAIADD
jgi:XRE family transcriptional regulator, regulator of sulfur utilization